MNIRLLIFTTFILFGCFLSFGQESRREVCVGFPVGKSTIDTTYGDNAARLSEVISLLQAVKKDSTLQLTEVSFHGYASPEGDILLNKKLAENRRAALEEYVRGRISLPDSIVTRSEAGVAWQRLTQLVEESDMPHKEEAMEVLRNVPECTYNNKGVLIDSRRKQLMDLQYGRTWHYMHDNFFSETRNSSVILITVINKKTTPKNTAPAEETAAKKDSIAVNNTPAPSLADSTAIAENATKLHADSVEAEEPFYMSLKTNLLYDALAVPNIGVEFYLGKNWSLAANWMYGWWNNKGKSHYWRTYGGDVAVRYWIGKKAQEKPLTGHHIGAYGQIFTYDILWGSKGYMGGEPGKTLWYSPNYAFGLEYGYSLPIARRLNMDFTLGMGYWGGKYYKYKFLDTHYVWRATSKRHWFGPTKAEISLVWLLGKGNSNKKKGGVR